MIETAIAIGLLFGLARRLTYIAGALFSLLIWSTAEGFGGPYTSGATNLGPALMYALVFVTAALFERFLGPSPYSLDYFIVRRFPRWRLVAEWAPQRLWPQTRPLYDWDHQLRRDRRHHRRPRPRAFHPCQRDQYLPLARHSRECRRRGLALNLAAMTVSPLSMTTAGPTTKRPLPVLPPLIGNGTDVNINLVATDATVEIANGVKYSAWTFNNTVPGPILHVREGQTVHVKFVNHGMMQHSIDFHAAMVAPNVDYRSINPGEQLEFSFVAKTPGVFIYHCSTAPVLQHIANGMYGAIVVDPLKPLPPADVSYVLVEAEWYTQQVEGRLMAGDYNKMAAATPDEVVFNGIAFQYKDNPLQAKVGQRVRLYFVQAGPNLWSSFHIIGGMFAAVYPDADASHALTGVSTYSVGPGQGIVFDAILSQPGKYPIVDHSMRAMVMGAAGELEITP